MFDNLYYYFMTASYLLNCLNDSFSFLYLCKDIVTKVLSTFASAYDENLVREKELNPAMKDDIARSNAASMTGLSLQRSVLFNSDARTRKAMQSAIPLTNKISAAQLQGGHDANEEFMSITQYREMFANQKAGDTSAAASSATPVARGPVDEGILSPEAARNSRFFRNRLGNIQTPTTGSTVQSDHAMALQLHEDFRVRSTFKFGLLLLVPSCNSINLSFFLSVETGYYSIFQSVFAPLPARSQHSNTTSIEGGVSPKCTDGSRSSQYFDASEGNSSRECC
jgi:hypothetical protein